MQTYTIMRHCRVCQLVTWVTYRVERVAAGGPLRCVGDTVRSSASEPTGYPAGDALPSVLLQHLRVRQKKTPSRKGSEALFKCLENYRWDQFSGSH